MDPGDGAEGRRARVPDGQAGVFVVITWSPFAAQQKSRHPELGRAHPASRLGGGKSGAERVSSAGAELRGNPESGIHRAAGTRSPGVGQV